MHRTALHNRKQSLHQCWLGEVEKCHTKHQGAEHHGIMLPWADSLTSLSLFLDLKNGDNSGTYFRGFLGKGSGTTSVHSRCSINSPIFSNFEHISNFRANPSQKKQLPRVPKKTRTQKRTHFVLF